MPAISHTGRPRARISRGPLPRLVRADSPDEVDRLAGYWPRVERLPSTQMSWVQAALTAMATEDSNCHVLAVSPGNGAPAIAPLVGKRWHGVWRYLPASADLLGEPTDLVWSDEQGLARVAAAVVRCGYPVCFPRLPADSRAVPALRRAARGRALCLVRPGEPYATLELDERWIQPERQLPVRDRRQWEGARYLAERWGGVTVEIHAPDLVELPELLDQALELDSSESRVSKSADALDRAVFYRQYAEDACVDGSLRISLLRVGNHLAAAQLAIESADALWLLHSAFARQLADCRPEQLLARETIRYAAEASLRSVEFWGGTSAWARRWTSNSRPCVSLRLYPIGVSGVAAIIADACVSVAGRWRLKSAYRAVGSTRPE